MTARSKVHLHWTGFDLPGRALERPEATGYARACWPAGADAEIEFLAVQIATMTALDDAFEGVREPVHPATLERLVPWRRTARPDRALGSDWEGMRAALASLDARLPRLTSGTVNRRRAVRGWWRRVAERQIAAFAREAAWRLDGAQPSLADYVDTGLQSIGVQWTAASQVALDARAGVPREGSRLSTVIDGIARAIRLANDLHDPERERKEGKVQWLLLRAREHVMMDGLDAPTAERVATAELRIAAAREVAEVRAILRGPQALGGTESLRNGLEGLLEVGLATYVPELALVA